MRNVLVIISLLLSGLTGKAQHEPDSSIILEAHVHVSQLFADKYVIQLYEGNEMIERIRPYYRKNQFLVYLMPGKKYTLEVQAPGHHSKFISIDATELEAGREIYYDFDVFLLNTELFHGVSKDLLDFPYALLYYDSTSRNFNYSSSYTHTMYKDYQELISRSKGKI